MDLYVPDCPKSTSMYLLCTKVVRKHEYRCFTAMYHFWIQYFLKETFRSAQLFKLFHIHIIILNVLLPKFSILFFIWVVFYPKMPPQ